MNATQVVVGRQPVCDASLEVVGYELLFRQLDGPNHADMTEGGYDGDAMTAAVLTGALSIGLDRLVGSKSIYCNADRGVLTGAVPLLLPPERTIVEVLETVRYDAEIDSGCRALLAAGYRLALDDFVWFDGAEELIRHASVVKLDVRALGVAGVLELGARCRPFGVQLLAEKVETAEELEACRASGFELFQGYALARPAAVRGTSLDASTVGVLRIAAAVLDENTDIAEVERIVRRDPALTVQLLQVASIGGLGQLRRPVRSIREALVLLGTSRLRGWVTLLLLRSSRATAPDDLLTVLARARMCELLAAREDRAQAAFGFTAGMVSALDRLLGIPAPELVDALPLDEQLLSAAFGGTGGIGQLIHRVIDFEAGTDDADDPGMQSLAASALDWAVQSTGALAGA